MPSSRLAVRVGPALTATRSCWKNTVGTFGLLAVGMAQFNYSLSDPRRQGDQEIMSADA